MVKATPAAPRPVPPSSPKGPVTISGPSEPTTHVDVQALVRESEELRRLATLADARAEFERLYADHGRYVERLLALNATVVCPADDLMVKLDGLAQYWFAPDVANTVYRQIDQLSAVLISDAASISDEINADPTSLSDATKPTAVILRERIDGLKRRVDDAAKDVRGMFGDLTAAHGQVRQRIEGLERTAQASAASGLDPTTFNLNCVTYCRKVSLEGRGNGYVTLSGHNLIFQPVRTTGILLWKSDHVASAEVIDVSGGLAVTDVHRPVLGIMPHGVTLRQEGPGGASFRLALDREALNDLVSAAS